MCVEAICCACQADCFTVCVCENEPIPKGKYFFSLPSFVARYHSHKGIRVSSISRLGRELWVASLRTLGVDMHEVFLPQVRR
jgi:hypothetical protein